MDNAYADIEAEELKLLRALYERCKHTAFHKLPEMRNLGEFYERVHGPGIPCTPMTKTELATFLRKSMESFMQRTK